MVRWDYDQREFLELRYEDVIADEAATFERVFGHYGLDESAAERGLAVVEAASFRNVAGRQVGDVAERSHLRSGRPGEWREHLSAAHIERMKELAGDGLIALGYEQSLDWISGG